MFKWEREQGKEKGKRKERKKKKVYNRRKKWRLRGEPVVEGRGGK